MCGLVLSVFLNLIVTFHFFFPEQYVDKLFGVNRDRMSMDLMSVLLVSHVNESRNHGKFVGSKLTTALH